MQVQPRQFLRNIKMGASPPPKKMFVPLMPQFTFRDMHSKQELWERFKRHYSHYPPIGLGVDVSRMNFPENFFKEMEPAIQKSFIAMAELEKGGIANPDEKRMAGHYWLRKPSLAPTLTIQNEIEATITAAKAFARDVHEGRVAGKDGPFKHLLLIGIGGSALGPQLVSAALGHPKTDRLKLHFLDNTDPDGMDKVFAELDGQLGRTLCLVISKSGGTKETRNGMLETEAAFHRAQIPFAHQAVAITGVQSALDRHASENGWIKRFPMWDWVGGRTSLFSAVGLVPAALQGIDTAQLLAGATACDEQTKNNTFSDNPSAKLAALWHYIGNGAGSKAMVVLPYKDRLELFSKYLQQLVMESLGKESDSSGRKVNQGLTVYGNKGSTDQHAYIQQLRDGLNNFFVTFIEVAKDRNGPSILVDPNVTSGDYLFGFMLGTREALFENGRESITLTIPEVSPFYLGVLIALFERAVGLYATLININAYHQPGVEAGKKAAERILALQLQILDLLKTTPNSTFTATQIANAIGTSEEVETVLKICEHLAANPDRHVQKNPGINPFEAAFKLV
jgi:glucose-6-phosphate isomerase